MLGDRTWGFKMNKIIIVCSGATAKGFIPPDNTIVIAVNNTINWLSRADYYFTLDPGENNRVKKYNYQAIKNQKEGVKYCVAYPESFPDCTMFERVADRTENGIQGYSGTLAGKRGLSEDPTKIHTGNSTYGALGLAYHLGFDKLVIIGLDGGGEYCDDTPAYSDNKPFEHFNELFSSALPQVEGRVINASMISKVTCFPQMTHKDAIEWLMEI